MCLLENFHIYERYIQEFYSKGNCEYFQVHCHIIVQGMEIRFVVMSSRRSFYIYIHSMRFSFENGRTRGKSREVSELLLYIQLLFLQIDEELHV